jgi:hypothetical protein
MNWFEILTGFPEQSPQQVRKNIAIDGPELTSQINGKKLICGHLETPSLAELRQQVQTLSPQPGQLSLREITANVQKLHTDPANANALFQVASQFNLLEMVSPDVTPEEGIGIYENDFTQGPACAIAAGAGTIYRNYFAPVNGQLGQSADNQIDCLSDLGAALGNTDGHLWKMENGYVLPSQSSLVEISNHLGELSESDRDDLRQRLRIGIQWNTAVTLDNAQHLVSQAYGSALPVAYSFYPSHLWADFAKLVLEASYEATICAAILNSRKTGNNQLFLTLLGGGAFGNETPWIMQAIHRALVLYRHVDLDVAIVSYRSSNPDIQALVKRYETSARD